MALAGDRGATLTVSGEGSLHARLFGEGQGRYVIAIAPAQLTALVQRAVRAGVMARVIGTIGGSRLIVADGQSISLTDLRTINEAWLPAYMAGADAP